MNFNKVMIMGRLCADPELRVTASGTSVCEIRLATNRKYKDQEEVLYIDVTLWAQMAEVVAKFMSKGRPIFVEGRLKLDEWEDNQGNKRSKIRVVAENFQFIGGREDSAGGREGGGTAGGSGRSGGSGGGQNPIPMDYAGDDDGEMPF